MLPNEIGQPGRKMTGYAKIRITEELDLVVAEPRRKGL